MYAYGQKTFSMHYDRNTDLCLYKHRRNILMIVIQEISLELSYVKIWLMQKVDNVLSVTLEFEIQSSRRSQPTKDTVIDKCDQENITAKL